MQFIIYYTNEVNANCRYVMQAENLKEVKLTLQHLPVKMQNPYIQANNKQLFLKRA
jgi:hypothetical protein